MKKLMMLIISLFSISLVFAKDTVDVYEIEMRLRVPVIVDNMQSLGKRTYKLQRIYGTLRIIYKDGHYPVIRISGLYNKNYKIRNKYVTYESYIYDEETKVNYIGNNKTGSFTTPTIKFKLDGNPSYNVGDDEPDNTLLVNLAGKGYSKIKSTAGNKRVIYKIKGNVSGQLGCGCHAYGHVSPTRVAGPNGATTIVEDIAAIGGYWRMIWKYRAYEDWNFDDE